MKALRPEPVQSRILITNQFKAGKTSHNTVLVPTLDRQRSTKQSNHNQERNINQSKRKIRMSTGAKIQTYESLYEAPSSGMSYQNQIPMADAIALQPHDPATATTTPNSSNTRPQQMQQQPSRNSKYVDVGTRRPTQIVYCPNCSKQHVTTRTRTKATGRTIACVGVGFFVFWPLCWVPLVCTPLKQTNHYCQNCGAKVGRVKPLS